MTVSVSFSPFIWTILLISGLLENIFISSNWDTYLCQRVTKILTLYRIKKIYSNNTMRKLRSIAFQQCILILRGGLPLVELSQNEDFLQKTASKTGFLSITIPDQLTLSSHNSCSKPPNLKNYHIFGILRTSAFRWAIGKPAGVNIVRSAATWNFS